MHIVLRQVSGLGNQLFQYAAGVFFSHHLNADWHLSLARDTRSYGLYDRPFLLHHFNIQVPTRPASTVERLLFSTRPALRPWTSRLARALRTDSFTETPAQQRTFLPGVPHRPGTRILYLTGYFQSFRYVEAHAALLRRDLTLRSPVTGPNRELEERIHATPHPVSLHIRRGDLLHPLDGNVILAPDFYIRAIAWMRERLHSPTFFVFSDEMPYARSILPPDLPAVFIDGNGDNGAHEDLRLMSACRHHIIANSSFSWWGAWLNSHPDKLVYAPRLWGRIPGTFFPDLLPPSWTLGQ